MTIKPRSPAPSPLAFIPAPVPGYIWEKVYQSQQSMHWLVLDKQDPNIMRHFRRVCYTYSLVGICTAMSAYLYSRPNRTQFSLITCNLSRPEFDIGFTDEQGYRWQITADKQHIPGDPDSIILTAIHTSPVSGEIREQAIPVRNFIDQVFAGKWK